MAHAHSLVAEAKTKAERIRGDSERELAAATQRRDSINAQLSNVRQMLAALGGVAVGNVAEMAEAIAEKPKATVEQPKTATPAQQLKVAAPAEQPKAATPVEAPKVAAPGAKPQKDVTDKATDDKGDDRKTGPTQPVGAKS